MITVEICKQRLEDGQIGAEHRVRQARLQSPLDLQGCDCDVLDVQGGGCGQGQF